MSCPSWTSPPAAIDRLPAELIQEIFILTDLDVNFPRASVTLSRKLTDRYVLALFCDRAFWTQRFESKAHEWRGKQERWRLQKMVFDMRWMTWEFFDWYLQRWKVLYSTAEIEDIAWAKASSTAAQPAIRTRMDNSGEFRAISKNVPQIVCPLPNKLLRGPFTRSKLYFIRCLLSLSPTTSTDWSSKTSVRLSTLAKRTAILEHNLTAVRLFARTRRLAKAPDLALVKFAVLEAGCDRDVVLELMLAAREWGHRRWADVELDAWVAREVARGSCRGRWVKCKLDELRYGGWPNPETGGCECLLETGDGKVKAKLSE